jgi:hypothetical protein
MFASQFGLTLIGAGLAAIVHGLLPFVFQTTASSVVKDLNAILSDRSRLHH